MPEALKVLQYRGDSLRFRRNTLLFLTAKRDEVRNLRNEVKKYLAWDSIANGDTRIPNLAGERRGQVVAAIRQADSRVGVALIRAYRWALAPVQSDPQRAEYHLSQAHTNAADTGEIFRSAFDKFVEDEALVDVISPTSLTSMLQQYVWNEEDSSDHFNIGKLWDLMVSNVYMHRLRDRTVLGNCIRQGVEQGSFGYAEGYDGKGYNGLRYGESMTVTGSMVAERTPGFLVRPEAATRQKEAERTEIPLPGDTPDGSPSLVPPDTPPPPPHVQRTRLIVSRKTAGANISLDDINLLRDEIIRNLTGDGGEVTVEITITANKPKGFSEGVVRSVRENSVQLGLDFTTDDD